MKQFIYTIDFDNFDEKNFEDALHHYNSESYSDVLAHVFWGFQGADRAFEFCHKLKNLMPKIKIIGSSSFGEINGGRITERSILLNITFFEKTNIETYVFDCRDVRETENGKKVLDIVNKTKDTRLIETIMSTHDGLHANLFLDEISKCDEDIAIFGAAAAKYDDMGDTFVFNENNISLYGFVVAIYSGEEFHVYPTYALGWKELGHTMSVTNCTSDKLKELDNEPAFNVYKRYLKIQNDEYFTKNALVFPLMHAEGGVDVARISLWCDDNGTLGLGGELKEGDKVRLGYGDPEAIIQAVYDAENKERLFQPETILIYSCMTRKTFWGDDINDELAPFEYTAPTYGFYTFGEYLRIGAKTYVHNATLIALGMREGNPQGIPKSYLYNTKRKRAKGEISMVERLVNFIQEATSELEYANMQLSNKASTDELTGIYNRRRIEELMADYIESEENTNKNICILLIDIDHFKDVNDTYGHEVGDQVLRKVAATIQRHVGLNSVAGRWGGEEFMIAIKNKTMQEALRMAEEIRSAVANENYDPVKNLTISVGLIETKPDENIKQVYKRVDDELYNAKKSGRNRVSYNTFDE